MRMTLKNYTGEGGLMIDPMALLSVMIVVCWVLRELCGLIDRRQRRARGDRR